jgi:hypothetical protein
MQMQQMMNSGMSVSSQKSYNDMSQSHPNEIFRSTNVKNPPNHNYGMGMMGTTNSPANNLPKTNNVMMHHGLHTG